jgi:hypothetical protein
MRESVWGQGKLKVVSEALLGRPLQLGISRCKNQLREVAFSLPNPLINHIGGKNPSYGAGNYGRIRNCAWTRSGVPEGQGDKRPAPIIGVHMFVTYNGMTQTLSHPPWENKCNSAPLQGHYTSLHKYAMRYVLYRQDKVVVVESLNVYYGVDCRRFRAKSFPAILQL